LKLIRVLFVCIHNSGRSQMAEAFLNKYGEGKFSAESAGLEAGTLNPIVVDAMQETGMDISSNKTKDVFDFYKAGEKFNYVITVCDESNAERCPIFPGAIEKIHWSFKDPAALEGSYEEKLNGTRIIRDNIKNKITSWIEEINLKYTGA
jgi:arsenate reductase (thioredoxin)